jgi:DNA-3-methyladenine glycosylase
VVAQTAGQPTAVLLRALEPSEGLDAMYVRRPAARWPSDLCRGPARLCAALGVDRRLDGVDLVSSEVLFIEQVRQRALPAGRVEVTPRIGVAYAGPWASKPLRFAVKHNPHVSRFTPPPQSG